MDLSDYKILVSLGISIVLLLLFVSVVGGWISMVTGWDFMFSVVVALLGVIVGGFLFGFFMLPGGEWFWKKKKKEDLKE